MAACLDAGKELARAYADTPSNSARQAEAVQKFVSRCRVSTQVASPTFPTVAGAATTQPNAATPQGQLDTGTISSIFDSVKSSPGFGYAKLAFWAAVIYVGFIAVLAVVKKVRRI